MKNIMFVIVLCLFSFTVLADGKGNALTMRRGLDRDNPDYLAVVITGSAAEDIYNWLAHPGSNTAPESLPAEVVRGKNIECTFSEEGVGYQCAFMIDKNLVSLPGAM